MTVEGHNLESHLAVNSPIPRSFNLGEGPCSQECADIVILHNRCWSRSLSLYLLITSPPLHLRAADVASVNPAPVICPRWRLNDADDNALLLSFISVPSSNQSPLSLPPVPSASYDFNLAPVHDHNLDSHLEVGSPVPCSVNLGEGPCSQECS